MPILVRFCAAIVTCFWISLVPAFSQQSTSQSPTIHVNVDRVNVGVIVTDSGGQFVSGLSRDDFQLFDDGVEQPITDFLTTEEPAQVLLLIEAGPAVYLLSSGHLQAVHSLLNGLSPTDRVAIARYNDAPEAILDFTPDKRVASAALDQLRFNLGFGQLNLASSVSTALDWLARVPSKKSLVLLSTGVDTSAASATQKLLARLKTSDVKVLTISLGAELRVAKPPDKIASKKSPPPTEKAQMLAEGFAQADEELKAIAEANGGRVYFPQTAEDFAAVFAEIAQLVRHEYSLAFVPPSRDGKSHAIEIRLANSSTLYRLDHRQAYVAPQ
jgi:Ca-activated chloride channel family protein